MNEPKPLTIYSIEAIPPDDHLQTVRPLTEAERKAVEAKTRYEFDRGLTLKRNGSRVIKDSDRFGEEAA